MPKTTLTKIIVCLAFFGLFLPLASTASTNMTPVALTGWNRDVIIESTAVGPPFTAYASELNPGEGTALYQTGLYQYAWGLPPSGAFVSMIGDATVFQFQPYTANNALVLSSETGLSSGTLTLATPATYASIAILAHSANDTNQTGALTLHFNDGSSYVTTYFAPDWWTANTAVAWFGNGRVNLTSGGDTGGTQDPRFFQTTINIAALLGATNKPLTSITFGQATSGATAIYCVSGLLAAGPPPVGSPIAATGYNRDMVVENTAGAAPYTNKAVELNPAENKAFYQHGLAGKTYGLPASGSFASAVDATVFQFQPYTGNNALLLSVDTGISQGSLTLTAPAIYNNLSVLAHSAGGGGTPNFTINFSDGSSLTTNLNAQDWFQSSANVAILGMDRINLSTGAIEGGPTNPRFYQTSVDLTALYGATNKAIASLTFNQAAGAGATAVYALSGVQANQSGGAFTLASVTNAPASGVQTRSATIGGGVVSGGGTVPEVFLYYGTSDGGTNAAAWSSRIYLGAQSGSFSQTLTGLGVNTTYYFTTVAINPAGTAWAASSQSFSTVNATVATITNLPAANLTATSALLYGNVLATGGDAPVVTLFYGPTDGGSSSGAWASSSAISGTQSGLFALPATGLSPATTYYFTFQAVNSAGASWGTPSQSFTTPAAGVPPANLVSVLTGRADNARTGANTNETTLTPANVNTNNFGRLFSYPVDGYVMAQPLVLPNVAIPGNGVHNLVIVATEHNSVYAFDADSNAGANSSPLWQTSFINPAAGVTPVQSSIDLQASSSTGFYGPEVGISGTPCIDAVTGTIYAEVQTKEISGGVTNFMHRLHALDAATGAEKFGGPVVIQGSVPGFGDGFDSPGIINFDSLKHMNRPALLLANGQVCITFTSHQDFPPYHGWVFTYNAYTLEQTGVFNTTPNGSGGGIWQASSGPAADAAGNIYFETGNGSFDSVHDTYGDTVVKLSTTNGLNFADYFEPYNQLALNLADLDIGSAGLILLPDSVGSVAHPHLMVAGSKTGVFWLLDRDNLGQFNAAGDTQIVQEISGATKGMWVTPAYFNHTVYYCASGDNVKAFAITNAVITTPPTSLSAATIGYPGCSLMVSANGTANAIVWGLETSANQSGPAVLHAYNATNLAQQLYTSSQNLARDNPGNAVKYTMPTIANGKVYVGSVNALAVYGGISSLATPVIAPNGGVFTNSVSVTLSSPSNTAAIYYTLDGSVPTTNSIFYTGPFVLTNSGAVLAVAAIPGQPNSAVASATFLNSAFLGNGTGLYGQYYANTLYTSPFTGTPLVRTDPTINFDWNTNSPDPSIPTSNYTVRWTGLVQPLFNETYTFYTTTDDGVRLWVNGQLVIDHWTPQSPTTWSGSIALQALHPYSLEMDYFQAGGGAVAQLLWSSPSTTQSIIPQSQLYPINSPLPVLFTSPGSITNGTYYLQLSGLPGKNYVLQASTNLVDWVALSTNIAPSTVLNLTDPSVAGYPVRFYRAVQLP